MKLLTNVVFLNLARDFGDPPMKALPVALIVPGGGGGVDL